MRLRGATIVYDVAEIIRRLECCDCPKLITDDGVMPFIEAFHRKGCPCAGGSPSGATETTGESGGDG